MRVRDAAGELASLGVAAVAVGFSPPDALAELADHVSWPFWFCSDERRTLYRRLGLGSAAARALFTDATRAIYSAARSRGDRLVPPVEDARQLGGDALVADGVARAVFRPSSPGDRPDVGDLLRAATELP